ncbi:DNA-binding response regulator [Clostridium zeae]|uniref:Stage 0 sporulation protein A homolog n=1 Tax=Clostridium zeae TaxID=2759022 RepID=A0ABQ1EEI7_9CLOT|nr:response regulator transcription factor [Clostridium zeae]GFZ33081.1 DNA-binding response regulator [Clostridium zeae]
MIKIIIVDDQEIVREGLKMILSLNEELEIIGEASNGQELLKLVETKRPEVVLMDIRMPVMNGIEATKLIKEKYPDIKIIILTTFNEDEYIFEGLKNGVDSYILKDSGSKEIIAAIKSVLEGEMLLNPKVTVKVINALNSMQINKELPKGDKEIEKLISTLTPRELEVARHVLAGKTNKDIAMDLYVTEGTVKNYVSKVLEKLELKSRSELIVVLTNNSLDDKF